MRTRVAGIVFFLFLAGAGYSQELEHYVNGTEGIKAGSLPPPGLYYRMYNCFYNAETLKDNSGKDVHLGLDVGVYAQVHRLIWITPQKFLGGDYGMDIALPWAHTDFDLNHPGVHDDDTTVGDILTHPLILSWHGAQWDALVAMGIFIPTEDRNYDSPADSSRGYWTFMPTWGGTYYFDKEKTWTASILCRYEASTRAQGDDIHPGDNFHFEWGVGKSFLQVWEAGVAGYCQWEVSSDYGKHVTWDGDRTRVFAIGPELSYTIAPLKLQVTARSEWEFGARSRPEGNITTLRLTKAF